MKIWLIPRFFIGGLFAYSGYLKVVEPLENFQGILDQYGVIPTFISPLIALTFPWIELIFGIFLIVGYLPRLSASVLGVLSAAFAVVLGLNRILYGEFPASCGCFGQSGIHLQPWQVMIMDVVNAWLAYKFTRLKEFPLSLDNWLKKPR